MPRTKASPPLPQILIVFHIRYIIKNLNIVRNQLLAFPIVEQNPPPSHMGEGEVGGGDRKYPSWNYENNTDIGSKRRGGGRRAEGVDWKSPTFLLSSYLAPTPSPSPPSYHSIFLATRLVSSSLCVACKLTQSASSSWRERRDCAKKRRQQKSRGLFQYIRFTRRRDHIVDVTSAKQVVHSTSARIYAHHKVRIIGKMTQLRGEGESLSSHKVIKRFGCIMSFFFGLFFLYFQYIHPFTVYTHTQFEGESLSSHKVFLKWFCCIMPFIFGLFFLYF